MAEKKNNMFDLLPLIFFRDRFFTLPLRKLHFMVEAKLYSNDFLLLHVQIAFHCSIFHPKKNAILCLLLRFESIMSRLGGGKNEKFQEKSTQAI